MGSIASERTAPEGIAAERTGDVPLSGSDRDQVVDGQTLAGVPHGRRQVRGREEALRASLAGVQDAILELGHVTGPVMESEGLEGVVLETEDTVAGSVEVHEVDREGDDVLAALGERGELDDVAGEVLPESRQEAALRDGSIEGAAAGGHDAHIHRFGLLAADAREGLVLEESQQTLLEGRGQVADLLEQHRAVRGPLEQSRAIAGGALEGALNVSEELSLEALRLEGRAAHGEERPAQLPAVVQGPGDVHLAHAPHAEAQHRLALGTVASDALARLAHTGALPHQGSRTIDAPRRVQQSAELLTRDAGFLNAQHLGRDPPSPGVEQEHGLQASFASALATHQRDDRRRQGARRAPADGGEIEAEALARLGARVAHEGLEPAVGSHAAEVAALDAVTEEVPRAAVRVAHEALGIDQQHAVGPARR